MATILVTGTGGGAGQSVLKALQHTDHRVIAADGEALGTGLYATGRGYVIPYASSPSFLPRLFELCRTEGVNLLFPGLDAELPVLSVVREAFAASGVTAIVSGPRVVAICDDKLLTAGFLHEHGFPCPNTWTLAEYPGGSVPVPLVLKPKVGGARSKGVRMVRSDADLAKARQELDGRAYVAQELIEGPEYSCGTITLGGKCRGVIVVRRILREGDTYKAFVERDAMLEDFVTRVADTLKPFGPCNFQLRVRGGVPYIFEFNARCSGTTYCRALAGFNEPQMIADHVLHGIEPSFYIKPITVLRYWKELAVENSVVSDCHRDGVVNIRSGPL